MKWINIDDKKPDLYQSVAFVVESKDSNYNNKVYGGTYIGFRFKDYHGFVIPGIEFKGKYWLPLPEPPI